MTRWSRRCRTPSAATTCSRWPASPSTTRTWAIPGHISCTENFNVQVTPYGIAERQGWEALNFFYNTSFDRDHQLVMDEPWSRPGDYVLLRAMNDLVCASSACPDDIDPANGWEITDVHVRVYSPENRFQAAIAHRVTPEAEPVLTKETAFHPRTGELTEELRRVPRLLASPLLQQRGRDRRVLGLPREGRGHGPLAAAQVGGARARTPRPDPDGRSPATSASWRSGQVAYTAVCNETGGMIDDATVFRLAHDNFRFIGGDPYTGVWLEELAGRLGLKVWLKPSTDELHNLAVQGPESRELMKKVVWTPPTQPGARGAEVVPLPGGPDRRLRRDPDRGLAHRLHRRAGLRGLLPPERRPGGVGRRSGRRARATGSSRSGLEALDMIRIEAGLIFAGYEFDDQVDPFEAGIGFAVKLESEDDFVGKEALIERKAHPQRTLVGLELEGNETAGHGDEVYVGRRRVGVVTSGTRSPTLRKNVALCRMNVQYSEIGTEVEVGKLDGHQKRIPAAVVRFPFYDPDKTRPRS